MTPELKAQIESTLGAMIEDYSVSSMAEDHRKHLGASEIGKPCSRQLFYRFRWAKREKPNSTNYTQGQLLRLYDRGKREEISVIKLLTGIGCAVSIVDPFDGEQYRISDCEGHFGGSLDGKLKLPPQFGINDLILLEVKTYKDSEFRKLIKEGVVSFKAEHWAQMCTYGVKSQLRYGLYVAVNKDNDDIHLELLQLDWELGNNCIRRAWEVINGNPENPPHRIALNSAYFTCKWCTFKDICHHGEQPEKNCRSCIFSRPTADKGWVCLQYQKPIDDELMRKGCELWRAVE